MNLPNGRPHAREVMMKIIIIGAELTAALQHARRCSLHPANWKREDQEGKRKRTRHMTSKPVEKSAENQQEPVIIFTTRIKKLDRNNQSRLRYQQVQLRL